MSGTPDVEKIELKVTVADDAVRRAIAAFGLGEPKHKRIWFGEVPSPAAGRLPLSARGLIVRLRIAKRRATATLKLRGPDGCLDAAGWRDLSEPWGDDAKIEGDWSGDRHLVSASLDHTVERESPPEPVSTADLVAYLSGEQRHLARQLLMPLDRLRPLGPIAADEWEESVPGVRGEVSFERWVVDDLCFLELSLTVAAEEAADTQPSLLAALTSRGIEVAPSAATKTETVLAHLVERL